MIKKATFLTLLSLLILYSCTSSVSDSKNNSNNDSIKKYLELAGNDSLPYKKRIQYNDKAYALIDFNKNDTLTRYNLYLISYKYFLFNNSKKIKLSADKLMLLSLKARDSISIAKAYRNLGLYYMTMSDNENAIVYLFKAKKIFKSQRNIDNLIKTIGDISYTQYYACDFLGSNSTCIEMMLLSKSMKNKIDDKYPLLTIAVNLNSLKNYAEAIKYYNKVKALTFEKRTNSSINNCLSINYIALNDYTNALKYINLNLKNPKLESTDPLSYSRSLSLNSLIKLKKGNLFNLEKDFLLAESYFKEYNSQYGRNYNQIYLSSYYSKIGDTINAIKAARKALKLSKSYKNPTDILYSLEQLIKVDKKHSSTFAQEYINVNDSLQIAERKFRDKFARIKYETDEITHEKEKAIQQKWIIASISACLILIFILILIISYQRSKQKELTHLQAQQQANEAIYQLLLNQKTKEEEIRQTEKKRIALELHDGIMNKLSSTRLNLSILSHKTDALTIQKCLEYINTIYQIEQDIRIISHDLNHEAFQNEDSFITLLEDLVAEQNKTSTTVFTLELDPDLNWETISSMVKINIYRIIQEGCQNIKKYAQAENAYITFTLDLPNLCMSITDDGIGFDTSVVSKGIGIQNMKARVTSLNGKISLSSSLHQNTSISISIPLVEN
jgi:signal transduction histidine kinase